MKVFVTLRKWKWALCLAAVLLIPASCHKVQKPPRNVLLLYSAGVNSLSGYLLENIKSLEGGFLPEKTKYGPDDILLVYSRQPVKYGIYTTQTPSYLIRFYADGDGRPCRDTLRTWGKDCYAASKQTMQEVLSYVKTEFPASHYGAIFSSHATGWLPATYYANPAQYEREHAGELQDAPRVSLRGRRLPFEEEFPPLTEFPPVKSMGQDLFGSTSIEMELQDFADAIPFKLDFLLVDACLAGGVELAYALRGKADIVGFSQTEVLADGLNYATLTRHIFQDNPDPVSVCRDYYEHYDAQSGVYRSATISVVDTRAMEPLVTLCQQLFAKYRTQIASLDGSTVQGYYRDNRHYFYDLEDILIHAGIDTEELSALETALDTCLLYKAATDRFISFDIQVFSGLSMYLPSMGTPLLDQHYRTNMAWNKATLLVE